MVKPYYKVLVCGSRRGCDPRWLELELSAIAEEAAAGKRAGLFIITGGAAGVDQRAVEWAREYQRPCAVVKADWGTFGKAAGPIRNSWMLGLEPDLVLAFPGGRGTENMVRQAREMGVPLRMASSTNQQRAASESR